MRYSFELTTYASIFILLFHLKELWSISPTFYGELLHQYFFAKKLQSQTVIREKLHKALSYEKFVLKMLIKLTPELLSAFQKGRLNGMWQLSFR
jgi:hypothetical protein